MSDKNLNIRLSDEYVKFLKSPIWNIIKYRWYEYQRRQKEYSTTFIRAENWSSVARLQGMVDGIDEIIKLTERLGKDIQDGTLDVDAALHVIENKESK